MADRTSESFRLLQSAQQMDQVDQEGQQLNEQFAQPSRWQNFKEKVSLFLNPPKKVDGSRRKFLEQSAGLLAGVAAAPAFQLQDLLGRPVSQDKPPAPFPKEKNPEAVAYHPDYLLSKDCVDQIENLKSDLDLGSNPRRLEEKIDKYFLEEPKNFRTLAKLFSPADVKEKLHPLGPYGEKLFELISLTPHDAYQTFPKMNQPGSKVYQQLEPSLKPEFANQSFAEIIGLPLEVVFSLMMAKAINESKWNHSTVAYGAQKGGIGIFQQENKHSISTFPDPDDLRSFEQQIIFELGKIASTAAVVKAKKGTFTFADLEYYYAGESLKDKNTKYGKAWPIVKMNFQRIIRNIAMFDTSGADLLRLFDLWQHGDQDYKIWPEKGVNGDQTLSKANFEIIFGSFLAANPTLSFRRSIGQEPQEMKVTNTTQYIALYLRAKYGGQPLPAEISKSELLGFSEENVYFALAYLGFKVRPYTDYQKNNKAIKAGTKYKLGDFLDQTVAQVNQKTVPPLFEESNKVLEPPKELRELESAEQPNHSAPSKNGSAEQPAHSKPESKVIPDDFPVGPELQPRH